MKVAVIGAGMVGVAAAQALGAEGLDVTVFERRGSVAEETSFAPAGIAASGLAAPWRSPAARMRTPWSRDDETAGLHETGAAFGTRATLAGGGRGAAEAVRNAERALVLRGLIEHGVERIDGLAQKLNLDFERDRGLLITLADAATEAQAEIAVDWLTQAGETVEWAGVERQRRIEPGRTLADSARLLAPLGVKLPWRAVSGCSVTAPLHLREAAPHIGPRAAVLDVRSGIAITRLGSRVRVAGGHELASRGAAPLGEAPPARTLQPLYEALDADFPGSVHWQHAQAWQAARPVLADGLPAVGASGVDGIWLNIGHAHHGWPLSQVAAEVLCALLTKQAPRVPVGALSPQRLG